VHPARPSSLPPPFPTGNFQFPDISLLDSIEYARYNNVGFIERSSLSLGAVDIFSFFFLKISLDLL
jgi:hypothetical protein